MLRSPILNRTSRRTRRKGGRNDFLFESGFAVPVRRFTTHRLLATRWQTPRRFLAASRGQHRGNRTIPVDYAAVGLYPTKRGLYCNFRRGVAQVETNVRWYHEPLKELRSLDHEHFYYGDTLIDIPTLQYQANRESNGRTCHDMYLWVSALRNTARELAEGKEPDDEMKSSVRSQIHYARRLGLKI